MTDDLTQARIGENQSTFREANENIRSAATKIGVDGQVPFVCECAEPTCTQIVRLELAEYAAIREHPRRFFNALGHEELSVRAGAGRVLERRDGYVLVEKTGIAGEIAEQEARDGRASASRREERSRLP
ncbi:MAG TPA: hypothetical protein VFB25_05865 [Gaiellaceae bacterium]|nr:hypothetical protein [Gaiellaceae bacterium]